MTTSIFSKLSQQSKHRDLLETASPDAPPIGNPRTGRTIAEFQAMGLNIRMICGTCRTSGPLDLSNLPNGANTESRIIAARCPACGSEAVSQEIVSSSPISGQTFSAFIRVPRVTPHKANSRSRLPRAEILLDEDLPADLLPILEKEITNDHDPQEDDDKTIETPSVSLPRVPPVKTTAKTTTKTAAKTPAKAPAKTPVKPPAKTPAKTSAKTSVKTSTKTTAKTPAKTPTQTPAKTPIKTPTKAQAKTSTKTPAKTSAKTPAKTSAKTTAKTSAKAPTKIVKGRVR